VKRGSLRLKQAPPWVAAVRSPRPPPPSPALRQVRACGDVGDTGTAFAVVSALDQAGVNVAAPVYAALLSACARAGKPARASAVLEDMWAEGVELTEACYAALREVRAATGWTAEEVAAMVRAAGFDSHTTTEARRRLMRVNSDATLSFGKPQSHRKLRAISALDDFKFHRARRRTDGVFCVLPGLSDGCRCGAAARRRRRDARDAAGVESCTV